MKNTLSTGALVRVAGLAVLLLASGATIWAGLRNRPVPEPPQPSTPEAVLAELKAGNERFVKSQRIRSADARSDAARRKELAHGQEPIAAVLGCADSRVAAEFVFDQGLGRIFNVSNAGNVVDSDVLVSMEYAVAHLHVPLVVVVGHKGCGAVAAVNGAGGRKLPGHLDVLREHMTGLLPEVEQGHGDTSAAFLARLAEVNARQQARRLLDESPVLRGAVKDGKAAIAVGLYDLESGAVAWSEFDPGAVK